MRISAAAPSGGDAARRSTATPNPYRLLNFASASLDGASARAHPNLGGFAAVKRDGKAAIVCLSFRTRRQKVADARRLRLPVERKRAAKRIRLRYNSIARGEFSPSVDINGWSSR